MRLYDTAHQVNAAYGTVQNSVTKKELKYRKVCDSVHMRVLLMHHEYAPKGQIINKVFPITHQHMHRISCTCFYNLCSHSNIWQSMALYNFVNLHTSWHSSPQTFGRFKNWKCCLKDNLQQFDDVQTTLTTEYQDCLQKWKGCWECVIQSNGDYLKECNKPDDKE